MSLFFLSILTIHFCEFLSLKMLDVPCMWSRHSTETSVMLIVCLAK